jgi:phage baseplate assembly protein W
MSNTYDAAGISVYYNPINAAFPGLANQQAFVSPPRNGMDRTTGQLLQGWPHVAQSLEVIFATPFHERVLRRWVGSFVPSILGENLVASVVARFFWSIISATDLWEPDYRVRQVFFMGNALSTWAPPLSIGATAAQVRLGDVIFRQDGVYFPRGHLGDFTPFSSQPSVIMTAEQLAAA